MVLAVRPCGTLGFCIDYIVRSSVIGQSLQAGPKFNLGPCWPLTYSQSNAWLLNIYFCGQFIGWRLTKKLVCNV